METETQTRKYEITYLITPQLNEEGILGVVKKIKTYIENQDGKIQKEVGVKKQKLAYPIKKSRDAYISTLNFELSPEKLEELNKGLKLEEKLLRYLVIIQPPFKAPAVKRKPRKEVLPPLPPKPVEEKAEKKPEELPLKKEIKIEELDKKLEEILEG